LLGTTSQKCPPPLRWCTATTPLRGTVSELGGWAGVGWALGQVACYKLIFLFPSLGLIGLW
jgi:hypothetical protein